jgi:hypothetical protein
VSPEQKSARRQARQRAARTPGLRVFKVREDRRLPWSYYAAASFDEAVAMHLRSYRVIVDASDMRGPGRRFVEGNP